MHEAKGLTIPEDWGKAHARAFRIGRAQPDARRNAAVAVLVRMIKTGASFQAFRRALRRHPEFRPARLAQAATEAWWKGQNPADGWGVKS